MCSLVTGVQTWALPISFRIIVARRQCACLTETGEPGGRRTGFRTTDDEHVGVAGLDHARTQPDRVRAGRARRHHRQIRTGDAHIDRRSEEHTSELQSLMRISYAVFCLKKKKTKRKRTPKYPKQPKNNKKHQSPTQN